MKILFITRGENLDYQNDCLFHGLCCLDGVETCLLNEFNYDFMFRDLQSAEQRARLYGRGFSIANRIDPGHKRIHSFETARENIRRRVYDLIIYGSVTRCRLLMRETLTNYPADRIVFIDGEDDDFSFRPGFGLRKSLAWFLEARSLAGKGIYFKRELSNHCRRFFLPVFFAVPSENIVDGPPPKKRDLAFLRPGRTETYIYSNEGEYHEAYRESRFALTFRKAGWDCLRHYEILADGCIPLFPGIEKLPPFTMPFFPRDIIRQTNQLYTEGVSASMYEFHLKHLINYTRRCLTTKFLAEYVLSAVSENSGRGEMPSFRKKKRKIPGK